MNKIITTGDRTTRDIFDVIAAAVEPLHCAGIMDNESSALVWSTKLQIKITIFPGQVHIICPDELDAFIMRRIRHAPVEHVKCVEYWKE